MNGDSLFQLIAGQTLQVTLLAVLVLALTKFFAKDRPHLAHALWALVLLKCLTPPLIASPTSVFTWMSDGYATVVYKLQSPPTENSRSKTEDQHVDGLAPVVVRVSPESNPNGRLESVSTSLVETGAERIDAKSLVMIAIFIWITMTVCVFTLSTLRLWIFLRRVKRTTLPTSLRLNRLVESVSKRIGLRRKVRIRTVDAAIGPSVVGLIWPTILLPKVIVEGKSNAELEPLLAHELIHIRRGDLVWAMIQGLSVSLWWFNPLVWLAERLLTREAERSCDEETIAGLGCSPAVYARSLLDVMERKHQLRAAPSLPGVRPVDITAKRLERIMRLGHGCYRQRPWWVVVVWLIGCAIVLPGAAWVAAQEKAKESVFKEAGFSPEGSSHPTTLPRESVDVPVLAEDNRIEDRSFQISEVLEIADLIERLCKDRNLAKSQAGKELIQFLQPVTTTNLSEFEDRASSEPKDAELTGLSLEECIAIAIENVRKSTRRTTISIVGDQIRIRATIEQLKQIERNIAHFRQYGFKSITTEIELYELPMRLAVNELAKISGKLVSSHEKTVEEVRSDHGLSGSLTSSTHPGAMILENAEIAKLKEWLADDDNVNTVQTSCPRLVSLSGQLATLEVGATREFTVAHEAVKSEDGKLTSSPVIRRVLSGSRYEIRATLTEAAENDDAQPIQINAKYQQTELLKVDKSKQKIGDQELEVDIPVLRDRSTETSVKLGVDETLVVIHYGENKTCITLTRCRPMATTVANVPQVAPEGRLKSSYVTVCDELQSEMETALLKQKLLQLGFKDFRVCDGLIQVSVNEDWKSAMNLCQELRSKGYLSSVAKIQSQSATPVFHDGEAAYSPIQVYGPFNTRRAPLLLRGVPYVKRLFREAIKLSVPSDDEILLVIEKQQSLKGLAPVALNRGQIRITTKKINQFSDPVRFVPLIGESILHHSHYKCMLRDVNTDDLKSVAYIDYQQFEIGAKALK